MTKIEIMLNGAGATYFVNETVEQIEKKLEHISLGYEDALVFKNAQDKYKGRTIDTLTISPSNCAVIEFYRAEQ